MLIWSVKFKSKLRLFLISPNTILANSSSPEVEHSTENPKIEGLNPTTGTEREEMTKSFIVLLLGNRRIVSTFLKESETAKKPKMMMKRIFIFFNQFFFDNSRRERNEKWCSTKTLKSFELYFRLFIYFLHFLSNFGIFQKSSNWAFVLEIKRRTRIQ